jgi:hypothetical protein
VTPDKVINRLMEFAPSLIGDKVRVHARCILATKIGIDVLAAFDIKADPCPVRIVMANRRYVRALEDGASPVTAIATGGHLMVTSDHPNTAQAWSGHLMIHVPAKQVLLDLDFRQFSRPAHGINLPETALFEWPTGTVTRECRNNQVQLAITRTEDDDFRTGADWQGQPQTTAIVRAVIRSIKANRVKR